MSGRRLTISSLLCADDQGTEQIQPEATQPHSVHTPVVLAGPGVPPAEFRDPQLRDPAFFESHRVAYRSRAYSDYDRGNHESMPLPLQPMHLRRHTPSPPIDDALAFSSRREHRGDVLGRPEVLASHSRPVSHEHEKPSFASHHLSQATSRQSPASRRSSDPSRPEYRLYEGSSYFSPPTSSRHSQADYLTTPSAFPQPPPFPHTHSHSPKQHSPPQFVPSSRRPSQSPALGLHHITDLPPIPLGRMSHPQHTSSPGLVYPLHSPRQPHSPSGPPLSGSPGQESLTGLNNHHRPVSFSQQEVSFTTPRLSSVTALLNAESTRSPVAGMGAQGGPGGLEGLAALAEVAVTEARRRVSGDLPSPVEVRETARRASLSPTLSRSPVLNRAPPALHQSSHSPVLQRSPILPSPRDTRVNSLAVIPLGGVSSHDGEPPSKKRRRTGSSGTGPHVGPHVLPPPPSAPTVSKITFPPAVTSHPPNPVMQSSVPHPRPVTPPAVHPQALHTTRPTSISQLLSPEPPPRVTPSVEHLLVSQPRLIAQDEILAETTPRPVTLEPSTLQEVPLRVEGKAEPVVTGPVNNLASLDGVREPYQPAETTGSPVPKQTITAEEEEEEGVLIHPVAMEEEEDVPGPAVVEEEEEPPVETATVKVEEPSLSLVQAQEEESPTPAPPTVSNEVPLPSAVEVIDDIRASPARSEMEDIQILPVLEQRQGVRNVFAQASADASDANPGPASVDAQDVPIPAASEVGGSLGLVDEIRPTSPEETIFVPAEPVDSGTAGFMAESSVVTKEEEQISTLPEPATMKHELHESSSMPPQVVHRLSHHEGKSRHSRVENRHQDDPHEWLLEHFADSPVCDSHRSSAAPEEPPQTPYISDGSPQPPVEKDSPKPPVSPPSKRAKRPKKKVPSPSRSPTPTALLEQELDGISAEHDEVDIPHAPRSPRSDADTDFGFEFDLAAGAAPDRDVDPDISMGNELDDELLSLVDDQPRHSHSHSHSYHAPSTKASRMSTATTRHEKPASVRDSVAKTSVAAAIPPPPPAPILLTAVSPSLTSPTTQADKPVASQTLSKREKAKVEGLSASMKNKEPAPKPIPKDKEKAQEKPQEETEGTEEAQEKAQEKPKPKPKPRPVAKPKVKVTGEKDNTAGSSGRLTPSSSGTVAKGKGKKSAAVNAAVVAKRGISAATGPSRSRSASEMPMPAEPQPKVKPPPPPQHEEEEASEEEAVDDKLYCICKTSYDEDKVMIACDRCDEWYHTQCLNINDLEVDLIDQFVCPPCVMANPNLPLKTTYKARCLAGLKHPHPSSPDACHKPARGAFSKFCSDECGIAYMQRRIEGWGGSHAVLWASVKDTKQREGVVVKVQVLGSPDEVPQEEKRPGATVGHLIQEAHEVQQPTKTQRDRKISRLQAQLDKLAPKREEVKRDLEVILWREKLLHLATVRADSLRNECGWDQRLCMDDEDYADYGGVVLESYEEGHAQSNGVDAMQVDATLEAGEWWCRGVKKCPRHAGWQKLRASEFDFDRKAKEEAISAMTAKEREIRGQLEDAISLPVRQMVISAPPLQLLNDHQPNGVKAKPNGTSGRKGKQKN